MTQLETFIKDNNLKFEEGSGGNSDILAICGYACYLGASLTEVFDAINTSSVDTEIEVERIYDYAKKNNYAKFWHTSAAKAQYTF